MPPIIPNMAAGMGGPSPDSIQTSPVNGPTQQIAPQQVQQAPTPAQPAPQQPALTPAAQHAIHAAAIGSGFKAVMKMLEPPTTTYQQGPNGPVPVTQPGNSGSLFRAILAGAITGAASGAQNADSPTAGSGFAAAARGASAQRDYAQQQDLLAQQKAQQQWQNQLRANEENRNQQAFDTEQQVRKAQIAQANAETLRTNMLTQNASLDQHQHVVDSDKARIASYEQAGLRPEFQNIPESQMSDIMKNTPGASALDWRHTGIKLGTDANGNPTYEYTLSAYNPDKPIPVSQSTIDQWDKDGLFKYHPEYKDVVKAGKPLTVGQFSSLDGMAQNYYNQDLAKRKDQLSINKDQAAIDRDTALKAQALANVHRINQEIRDAALGKTQAAQFDKALEDLNANGGDFSKLKPSSRVLIAESMNKMVPELTKLYQTQLNDMTDPNHDQNAAATLSQIQTLSSLGTRALATIGTTGAETGPVAQALSKFPTLPPDYVQKLVSMKPEEIEALLPTANMPPDLKAALYKAIGKNPPEAQARKPFEGSKPGEIPTPPQLLSDTAKTAASGLGKLEDKATSAFSVM